MNNDINVEIHTCEYLKLGGNDYWGWNQNNVYGPYWRLYWNSCGGAFVKVNRREVELTPDKVVLLAPNTVYSTRTTSECSHLYVHFSAAQPLASVPAQMFELKSQNLIETAESLAISLTERRNNWKTSLQVRSLINAGLLSIPDYAVPQLHEYDRRIAAAIAAIENHLQVSNFELAQAAKMSVNGFLQLFSQEIGIPPQTYLRRKRLNDASKMLHFSNNTIEEIAIAEGFCDRYHFSRAFKQEFGVGPAQFRRQAQRLRDAAVKKEE